MTNPLPNFTPENTPNLADELTRMAGHLNAGSYRFLKMLGEFDRGLSIETTFQVGGIR